MDNKLLPTFPSNEHLEGCSRLELQSIVTRITGLPLNGASKNNDALTNTRKEYIDNTHDGTPRFLMGVRSATNKLLLEDCHLKPEERDELKHDPIQMAFEKKPFVTLKDPDTPLILALEKESAEKL